MAELSRRTRLLLAVGLAGAAGVVTLGGVAYAVSGTGDGSGDSAYVQIEGNGATTSDTAPETTPDEGTQGNQGGQGSQGREGWDCPEKDGSGGGQDGTESPETPAQPETAPDNSNAAGRA
jgi:hypothetical protein